MKHGTLTLIAGLLGLIVGLALPESVPYYAFLGKIFISLLKVLLIPFVAASLFLALSKVDSTHQLKSLSVKTALYYISTSALACVVGLSLANFFLSDVTQIASITFEKYQATNVMSFSSQDYVSNFIPSNIVQSIASSNVVHVVFFTLFIGAVSTVMDPLKKKPLVDMTESFYELLNLCLKFIIKMAPLGVFALVAETMAQTDTSVFSTLGSFFLATGLACLIHSLITLPMIGYTIGRFNAFHFLFKVKDALIVAISTASSSATMPVSLYCLEENAGVAKSTTRFTVPIGTTLNMDGSALYQALVVILLANVSGMDLALSKQIFVFFLVMISSAGAAGIPGGGIMVVSMILQTIGVPLELIGLFLLVDRFWDYPVTAVNVWGDLIGAKVVDSRLRS